VTSFLLVLVLLAELVLLRQTIRTFGYIPSPTFILIAILFEQLTLFLLSSQIVENDFLSTYSHGGVYTAYYQTEFLYGAIFFFYWLAHLGLASRIESHLRGGARVSPRVLEAMDLPLAIAVASAQLVFALLLKWGVAWRNGQYLAMTEAAEVLSNPRFGFMLAVFFGCGAVSATAAALYFAAGKFRWGWAFIALTLFPLLYELGAHSRQAAVFPLMFGLTLAAVAKRRLRGAKIAAGVACVMFIATALVGRAGYEHGLSTTPATLVRAISDVSRTGNNLLTNVFEGSSVVAESLQVPAVYSDEYKLLSLAPTPSFIDGFADDRAGLEHRLSVFAPLSGIVEVLDFGVPYTVALLVIVLASTRLVFSQIRSNHILYLIANLLLFISFVTLNTYSARTGLRWIWLADGLVCTSMFLREVLAQLPRRANAHPSTVHFGTAAPP